MKTIIRVIAIGFTISIAMAFMSCSPESEIEGNCGYFTGKDKVCSDLGCTYYIYLDGRQEDVEYGTWSTAFEGEYICLENRVNTKYL